MKELDFYLLDLKYIRALAKTDDNVMSVSPQTGKQTRPFLGVIILLNGKNYCIPLTSPKQKFQKSSGVDFVKIFDTESSLNNESNKLIGVLNINNMIPIAASVIQKYNTAPIANDTPQKRAEKRLRAKQLNWCREHSDTIYNRANKVYKIVTETPEKSRNLVRRCCDFKRLEKVLDLHLSKNTFVEKPPVEHSDKHEPIYPLSRKQLAKNTKTIKGKETSKSKDKSVHKKKNKSNLE